MHWLFAKFVHFPGAAGLLAVRLAAGAALLFHGWPKIQNPTDWMHGAPVPGFLQAASAVAEFGGGISLILGLLTPLFSLLLVGNMAFAVFVVHVAKHHVFVGPPDLASSDSAEAAVLYLVIALQMLLTGPGILSFDYLLFGRQRASAIPTS
jgi:putative oxidoreductase